MELDTPTTPAGGRWLPAIDGIVEYAFHLLVFAIPLAFYVESDFKIYEYAKLRLLYTAATVIAGGWVLGAVLRRRVVLYRTPLDLPLALWVAALGLATALSTNVARSLWGRPETPSSAFAPIAVCVALYFVFVATLRTRQQLERHAGWLIAGGALAAAYSILQHVGLDSLVRNPGVDLTVRSFGAMGNASPQGWYLALMLPITAWAVWRADGAARFAPAAAWCLLVYALLTTGTRSGYVGAWCGLALLATAVFVARRRGVAISLRPMVLLAALAALSAAVYYVPRPSAGLAPAVQGLAPGGAPDVTAATAPAPPATIRSDGMDRLPIWRDAIRIWQAHPLVGSGPETFGDQHNLIRSSDTFKDFLVMFGHAHNQLLQVLATSGAIGLGTYGLALVVFLVFVYRQVTARDAGAGGDQPAADRLWAIALAGGFVSIAASQNFNPDFVATSLLYYLLPAAAVCWAQLHAAPRTVVLPLDIRPFAQAAAAAGLLLAMALGLQFNARMWNAHLQYQQGLASLIQSRVMEARERIDAAIDANPSDANFWWVKAQTYASLAVLLKRENRDFGLMQTSERVAVASSDRSVAIDPHREDLWRQRAICLRDLIEIDPTMMGPAIDAIQQAIARFPRSGLNYLLLARFEARAGRRDAAILALEKAAELSPSISVAQAELAALRYRMGDQPQAAAAVEKFLATSPQMIQRNVLLTLRDEAARAGDEATRAKVEAYLLALQRGATLPAPR